MDGRPGFLRIELPAWRLLFWVTCALVLLPVAGLLSGLAIQPEAESWESVRNYLLAPSLRDSAILVGGVCLVSLLLGVAPAWCVANYEFPGRRLLSALLVLPLAVPPYIAAYVSTEAREALFPALISIRREHGVDVYLVVEVVQRYAWLCIMLAAVLYPYVFLAARAAFATDGQRLRDAARSLGAGPWRTFFTVSLPMARPALAAGLFLVAMETLNDYGAVSHFGIQSLTPSLFRVWFGMGDLPSATRLATMTLAIVLVLRLLEVWQRRRVGYSTKRRPLGHAPRARGRVILGCWLACLGPILLGFIYPCVTLLGWLQKVGLPEDGDAFVRAALHTLGLGLGVTALCGVGALVVVGLNRFLRSPSQHLVARGASVLGYASPGAVLAIGVFGFAEWMRHGTESLAWLAPLLVSGSIVWLIFGLSARYFAVAAQMVQEGYERIPRGVDAAARSLGRGPAGVFGSIHLPLLRPAMASAAVLVFIDVLKELPLSLLLRPFEFETLGTWTYSLANEGRIFACAGPALTIVVIGSAGLLLAEFTLWKRR